MTKRVIALFVVIALTFTLVLTGCSLIMDQSTDIQSDLAIMDWNIGGEPKTLDPILNGANDGGNVINQTFEGLVREKSGVVYPGIAESWDISADGLTIIFHLRESKWSDGSDLTAHDFVYSWKRGMDPATASEYAWIWEYTNIVGASEAVNGGSLDEVGIRALGDYTLEIKLNTPTDYIVSLLSFYHFMPTKQSAVEAGPNGTWANDPKLSVSNGPFVLTSFKIGEGLSLVKNEYYWNSDAVKLDGIEGKFIEESSTGFQGFQREEFDIIPSSSIPTPEVPKLIAEDPNFYIFPLLGTYYYNFNLNLELWKDAKVRRALAYAIDREAICKVLGAGQIPAVSMTPPGFIDSDGKDFSKVAGNYGLATDSSNIELAKQLLAEAGYENGIGFPQITLTYSTSNTHKLVAELVQEMFKKNLGITVKLENQEWAVFQNTLISGNYELALGGWVTDFMDPMGLLSIFTSDNDYNDPKYNNSEYDALLSTAAKTRNKEHFEALYNAQSILMNDMPIIPIYHYAETMMVSSKLKDWDRSVLGTLDFSNAYLVNE